MMTIEPDVHKNILAAVARDGVSVSAWITVAARKALQWRAELNEWAEHKVRLEFGILPLGPAPVLAQVSRSTKQAQLRRFLAGCTVIPPGEREAHEAGRLPGKTRTADVVDAV
jgi:hypothetical protein